MHLSELHQNPSKGTLRLFAVQWIVFLGAVAAWQGFFHDRITLAWVLAILAVTIGPLGLWRPKLIQPFYTGVVVGALPIGWVVSRVILAIVFYCLFTPLALLFRLRGRDLLGLRAMRDNVSYWTPRTPITDLRRYLRQF